MIWVSFCCHKTSHCWEQWGRVKSRKEIPPDFLPKTHKEFKSKFAFTSNTALVSYAPRKNRMVVLLSTMHNRPEVLLKNRAASHTCCWITTRPQAWWTHLVKKLATTHVCTRPADGQWGYFTSLSMLHLFCGTWTIRPGKTTRVPSSWTNVVCFWQKQHTVWWSQWSQPELTTRASLTSHPFCCTCTVVSWCPTNSIDIARSSGKETRKMPAVFTQATPESWTQVHEVQSIRVW